MRAFVALEVPPPVLEPVKRLQAELSRTIAGFRWVKPEGIHLTLKFLGEIGEESVAEVGEAVKRSAGKVNPFELYLSGLGAFPDFARARVIWVGVKGDLEPL